MKGVKKGADKLPKSPKMQQLGRSTLGHKFIGRITRSQKPLWPALLIILYIVVYDPFANFSAKVEPIKNGCHILL